MRRSHGHAHGTARALVLSAAALLAVLQQLSSSLAAPAPAGGGRGTPALPANSYAVDDSDGLGLRFEGVGAISGGKSASPYGGPGAPRRDSCYTCWPLVHEDARMQSTDTHTVLCTESTTRFCQQWQAR